MCNLEASWIGFKIQVLVEVMPSFWTFPSCSWHEIAAPLTCFHSKARVNSVKNPLKYEFKLIQWKQNFETLIHYYCKIWGNDKLILWITIHVRKISDRADGTQIQLKKRKDIYNMILLFVTSQWISLKRELSDQFYEKRVRFGSNFTLGLLLGKAFFGQYFSS